MNLCTPEASTPKESMDLGTTMSSFDFGTPRACIDLGTPRAGMDLCTPRARAVEERTLQFDTPDDSKNPYKKTKNLDMKDLGGSSVLKTDMGARLQMVQERAARLENKLMDMSETAQELNRQASLQERKINTYRTVADACQAKYAQHRSAAEKLQRLVEDISSRLEEREKDVETMRNKLRRMKRISLTHKKQVERLKTLQVNTLAERQQEREARMKMEQEKLEAESELFTERIRYQKLLTDVENQRHRLFTVRAKMESLDPTRVRRELEFQYRADIGQVLQTINSFLANRQAAMEEAEMTKNEMNFRQRVDEANAKNVASRQQHMKAMKEAAEIESRFMRDMDQHSRLAPSPEPDDIHFWLPGAPNLQQNPHSQPSWIRQCRTPICQQCPQTQPAWMHRAPAGPPHNHQSQKKNHQTQQNQSSLVRQCRGPARDDFRGDMLGPGQQQGENVNNFRQARNFQTADDFNSQKKHLTPVSYKPVRDYSQVDSYRSLREQPPVDSCRLLREQPPVDSYRSLREQPAVDSYKSLREQPPVDSYRSLREQSPVDSYRSLREQPPVDSCRSLREQPPVDSYRPAREYVPLESYRPTLREYSTAPPEGWPLSHGNLADIFMSHPCGLGSNRFDFHEGTVPPRVHPAAPEISQSELGFYGDYRHQGAHTADPIHVSPHCRYDSSPDACGTIHRGPVQLPWKAPNGVQSHTVRGIVMQHQQQGDSRDLFQSRSQMPEAAIPTRPQPDFHHSQTSRTANPLGSAAPQDVVPARSPQNATFNKSNDAAPLSDHMKSERDMDTMSSPPLSFLDIVTPEPSYQNLQTSTPRTGTTSVPQQDQGRLTLEASTQTLAGERAIVPVTREMSTADTQTVDGDTTIPSHRLWNVDPSSKSRLLSQTFLTIELRPDDTGSPSGTNVIVRIQSNTELTGPGPLPEYESTWSGGIVTSPGKGPKTAQENTTESQSYNTNRTKYESFSSSEYRYQSPTSIQGAYSSRGKDTDFDYSAQPSEPKKTEDWDPLANVSAWQSSCKGSAVEQAGGNVLVQDTSAAQTAAEGYEVRSNAPSDTPGEHSRVQRYDRSQKAGSSAPSEISPKARQPVETVVSQWPVHARMMNYSSGGAPATIVDPTLVHAPLDQWGATTILSSALMQPQLHQLYPEPATILNPLVQAPLEQFAGQPAAGLNPAFTQTHVEQLTSPSLMHAHIPPCQVHILSSPAFISACRHDHPGLLPCQMSGLGCHCGGLPGYVTTSQYPGHSMPGTEATLGPSTHSRATQAGMELRNLPRSLQPEADYCSTISKTNSQDAMSDMETPDTFYVAGASYTDKASRHIRYHPETFSERRPSRGILQVPERAEDKQQQQQQQWQSSTRTKLQAPVTRLSSTQLDQGVGQITYHPQTTCGQPRISGSTTRLRKLSGQSSKTTIFPAKMQPYMGRRHSVDETVMSSAGMPQSDTEDRITSRSLRTSQAPELPLADFVPRPCPSEPLLPDELPDLYTAPVRTPVPTTGVIPGAVYMDLEYPPRRLIRATGARSSEVDAIDHHVYPVSRNNSWMASSSSTINEAQARWRMDARPASRVQSLMDPFESPVYPASRQESWRDPFEISCSASRQSSGSTGMRDYFLL